MYRNNGKVDLHTFNVQKKWKSRSSCRKKWKIDLQTFNLQKKWKK